MAISSISLERFPDLYPPKSDDTRLLADKSTGPLSLFLKAKSWKAKGLITMSLEPTSIITILNCPSFGVPEVSEVQGNTP